MLEDILKRLKKFGQFVLEEDVGGRVGSKAYDIYREYDSNTALNFLKLIKIVKKEAYEVMMKETDFSMLNEEPFNVMLQTHVYEILKEHKDSEDIDVLIEGCMSVAEEGYDGMIRVLTNVTKLHEDYWCQAIGTLERIDSDKFEELVSLTSNYGPEEKARIFLTLENTDRFGDEFKEKAIEVYGNKNFIQVDNAINKIRSLTRYHETATQLLEIISKYADHRPYDLLCNMYDILPGADVNSREDAHSLDLDELMTDRAFKAISKDPEFAKEILKKKCYSAYIIKDEEFGRKIDYSDFALIEKTRNYVIQIHRRRFKYHDNITKEFYSELNRAIEQGHDFKSKVKNLRTYCKEVREQMMARMDELMVVHNV